MPVIKLFTARPLAPDAAEALALELEALCTGPLRAAPSAVQIVLVPAATPRGAAVLLEAHYRDQPYRDAQALAAFMDGAERAVQRHLGALPRIRCFAVDQTTLHARH